VKVSWISAKLLARLALLSCSIVLLPLHAQQLVSLQDPAPSPARTGIPQNAGDFSLLLPAYNFRSNSMPAYSSGYSSTRARIDAPNFNKAIWSSSPGTIDRMEAAFYCNDTPFVDQVRLPLATFWGGRLKLTGFESDVTTANFVLGLPGQGALHNLSAFGNAFLATHTPPSDQMAGIHMSFTWRGSEVDSNDRSGLRGIEYLVHASRGFLPFWGPRPDTILMTSR